LRHDSALRGLISLETLSVGRGDRWRKRFEEKEVHPRLCASLKMDLLEDASFLK